MIERSRKFLGPYGVALIAALIFVAVSSSTAWAQEVEPVDVAVFELTGQGVDEELRETLTSVLRQEARQHRGYSLATPAAVRRDEVAVLIGCDPDQTECLRQMADYVEGQVLIFGEVERRGRALAISIDILDAQTGEEPVRVESLIDGSRDPVMAFRREVEDIFKGMDSIGETHLVVEAPGDDIVIRLEGVEVARGKLERRGMRPGTYRITVGDDGNLWDGQVELVAGQLVEVRPEAPPEGDEEQAEDDPAPAMAVAERTVVPGDETSLRSGSIEYERRRSNVGAYSMMTVGASSMAMSGVMVFLMRGVEQQIRDENAAGTMDTNRYRELTRRGESYQTAQYVLLTVGAATVASGAGWAIWNHSRDRSDGLAASTGLEIGPAPLGVVLSGRW